MPKAKKLQWNQGQAIVLLFPRHYEIELIIISSGILRLFLSKSLLIYMTHIYIQIKMPYLVKI